MLGQIFNPYEPYGPKQRIWIFHLYEFLHFWKVEIYQIITIQSLKNGENYIFNTSKF